MIFNDLDIEALRRRCGKKWGSYPPEVLPAWVADMDFPVAPAIEARLDRVMACSDLGYPLDTHADRLVELLVRRSGQRFQWAVDPGRVELLADVMQGVRICLQLFSEPGQGIAIQTPIYPPFLQAAAVMGRRADCCTLVPGSDGFEVDWETMEASIRDDTRILLLCNPHNPTGRVFTRDELTGFAELALKHDLTIVSDEIHADLVFDDRVHIPIASLDREVEARTVTLTSATKAFNIAGLRCAMMIFGSQALHSPYCAGPRHIRGAVGSLGMHATEAAWSEGDTWLAALNLHLQDNRDSIQRFLSSHLPALRFQPPQATYLAWIDAGELGLGDSLWQTVFDRGALALNDGRFFGPGGEHCIRLNFATSEALLEDALHRLRRALT